MKNIYGNILKLEIFGTSHAPYIGGILSGFPRGVLLDAENWRREMLRRAPGHNFLATGRREEDQVQIKSGVLEGVTTGEPIEFILPNKDVRDNDYKNLQQIPRPSHADYPAMVRGLYEPGGGIFSGRMTAVLVFVGALAKQILRQQGIGIYAHIQSVGNVQDRKFNPLGEEKFLLWSLAGEYLPLLIKETRPLMEQGIKQAQAEGDSVGGIVEIMVTGVRVGLGEPFFDSVESRLSHVLFSVPAVKAVEFGEGFALCSWKGSRANDVLYFDGSGRIRMKTNHNGGINGGLTNGMPLVLRVGIKPTPSIGREQDSVNLATGENVKIKIQGRHDPCIVPRAVPVVEACTAWVLLDLLLEGEKRN